MKHIQRGIHRDELTERRNVDRTKLSGVGIEGITKRGTIGRVGRIRERMIRERAAEKEVLRYRRAQRYTGKQRCNREIDWERDKGKSSYIWNENYQEK